MKVSNKIIYQTITLFCIASFALYYNLDIFNSKWSIHKSHLKKRNYTQNSTFNHHSMESYSLASFNDVSALNLERFDNFSHSCPRFLIADHDGSAGLGHRFGSVVFAMNLALEFGLRVVLHDNLWIGFDEGHSTTYTYFKGLLLLDNFLSHSDFSSGIGKNIVTHYVIDREHFFDLASQRKGGNNCNVAFHVKMGTGQSCQVRQPHEMAAVSNWCFSGWPGAYQRAKRYLKVFRAVQLQNYSNKKLTLYDEARNNKELTIAWHLRCGDIIVPRSPLFFSNIYDVLRESNVPLRHFILSENLCKQFDFLKDILINASVFTLNLQDTVLYLQNADILIHTGSSLTYAAHVSGPQNGLFFESQPKEVLFNPTQVLACNTFHILSAINFNLDGQPSPLEGHNNDSYHVVEYVKDLYTLQYGNGNLNLDIYERLLDKYVVGNLDDLNYGAWSEIVKEISKLKGVWIIRLFYNTSTMTSALDTLRYDTHVELIDVNVLGRYVSNYKYLVFTEAFIAGAFVVEISDMRNVNLKRFVKSMQLLSLKPPPMHYVIKDTHVNYINNFVS